MINSDQGQKNYYDLLGVKKNATTEEIKRAFKKLSLTYHPDVNKEVGAQKKYNEITEAYRTLCDPNKRQQYDLGSSSNGFSGGGFEGFAGFQDFNTNMFADDIFSFFNFGDRKESSNSRGQDINMSENITLEDAFEGKNIDVVYERYKRCSGCNGTGSKTGKPQKCMACNGTGYSQSKSIFGIMQTVCKKCRGSRYVSTNDCPSCSGNQKVRERVSLCISIPVGIQNGDRIQLTGAGNQGTNGEDGNLNINISIKEHKKFKRDGADLYCKEHVSIGVMVMGGMHRFHGICNELIEMSIPKGTQAEFKLRVPTKGMKYQGSDRRGNLYVTIIPLIPKTIPNELQDAWQKIYDYESSETKQSTKKGFFYW